MHEHAITAFSILAQASLDASIDRFLELVAKLLLVISVVLVVYGGIRVHRGESSEGLQAIVGGFIVALAIPIVRYLFSIV